MYRLMPKRALYFEALVFVYDKDDSNVCACKTAAGERSGGRCNNLKLNEWHSLGGEKGAGNGQE